MRLENMDKYKSVRSSDTGSRSWYIMYEPLPEHVYFSFQNDTSKLKYGKRVPPFIRCDFSRTLNNTKYLPFEKFHIDCPFYKKEVALFPHELNFFCTLYDNNEELIPSLLKYKSIVDDVSNSLQSISKLDQVIALIYGIVFTPSLMESVDEMVNDSYVLSSDSLRRTNFIKKGSEQDINKRTLFNSIEFDPQHQMVIIKLGFLLKIMMICIVHWFNLIMVQPRREQLYKAYQKMVELVSRDIDIYNKLFIFGESKILESIYANRYIYDQQAIEGNDYNVQIQRCLENNLIVGTIPKITLPIMSHHYSPLGYIKSTFIQYKYTFIRSTFDKQYKEILFDNTGSEEDYSVDTFLKYMKMTDEGSRCLQEKAISQYISKIIETHQYPLDDDEVMYMLRNDLSQYQKILVDRYWVHEFGCSSATLGSLNLKDYAKLMIILYRNLIGDDCDDCKALSNKHVLPYILTGRKFSELQISDITSTPLREYIINHPGYVNIMTTKFNHIGIVNPEFLLGMIENLCISKFKYRIFMRQDLDDTTIDFDQYMLVDEILEFLLAH